MASKRSIARTMVASRLSLREYSRENYRIGAAM
jgi:hypothetical protein